MTIVSLTGASGVGKSTLEHALCEYFGGGLTVRTTTRKPRFPNEPGHEFISVKEMENLPARERCVLPPVVVHGNWYAAREKPFFDALKETSGHFAIICITPERHRIVREHFILHGIKTIAIHLLSPSEGELRQRLAERNWTNEELEFRIRDSRHFDEWARREGDMYFFESSTQENILVRAIRLIETN